MARLSLLVLLGTLTLAAADPVEQWTPDSRLGQSLFDATTLRKRWSAEELARLGHGTLVDARPVTRDRYDKITGEKRAAVPAAVANAKGHAYQLDLGTLGVSTYVIRVVAMVPTAQLDDWRRPLTLELTVNDRPGGGTSVYRQRIPYWDDFYEVAELYFNADEPRHYTATLKVADGSQVDLDVEAVELHDCLAGLVDRAAKKLPGTYTYDERARIRHAADRRDVEAQVEKEVPLDAYVTSEKELTSEQRRARDDLLWNSVLPANSQYLAEADEDWLRAQMAPGAMTAADAAARYGTWELPAWAYSYRTAWHTLFELHNTKLGKTYSLDDLVHHRSLPQPYPFADRGDGVYFQATAGMSHAQHWLPIAAQLGWWWEGTRLPLAPYHGNNYDRRLPYLYYAANNRHAARDAAFMLARWAYLYPTLSDAQMLGFALVAPYPPFHRDYRLRARRFGYARLSNLMLGLLHSYDQLFDYIDGNQELARDVGRYIPWIKTDADLRRMIERRLVQYAAKQMIRFQRWDDKDSPTWLMTAAAIEQDATVTRPWLEQLWKQTWIYPYPPAGLPDLLSTTTQRNGSTTIGSVFYTQAGTPFAELIELSHRYVANGGAKEFDLEDPRLFGKLIGSPAFPLETSVAGGFPLTIGDVGGIDKPRLLDHVGDFAANWRRGWRWTHDPRMAWLVVNSGRTTETDSEWAEITRAAAAYGRNPFLAQHSRVLVNWAGILEAGEASDNYRHKRTAYLRVGTGYGHNHLDTLDLQLLAHGVRIAGDLGWRGEYSRPSADSTLLHNRLEVDDKDAVAQGSWQGHAWIDSLVPLAGAQYMSASADPPTNHASTRSYRRELALVDASDRDSYVLDVQRIDGGTYHTWCFHGPATDQFDINATSRHEVGPAATDKTPEATYLRSFLDGKGLKEAGTAPTRGPLIATWRLRRTEEVIVGADPKDGKQVRRIQRNSEKLMLGRDYDDRGPARFLRTFLFGRAGDQVLVARPTPLGPDHEDSTWPFVFVRENNDRPASSVYLALHEPYIDRPFIARAQPVDVRDAGKGADQAVAVEVTLTDGRVDLVYSDGDPSRSRQVAGASVRGAHVLHSRDAKGLRVVQVVDGGEYIDGEVGLRVAETDPATIARVDYPARRVWIETTLPAPLWVGQHIEIVNDLHTTSFGVIDAKREGSCVVLTLDGALDLSYAHVVGVEPSRGEITANLGPVDAAVYPGMNGGLTLTNADMSRAWHVKRVVGDQPNRGYVYAVDGTVDEHALPVGSTLRLWELGVGDTVRLASYAQLRRVDSGPQAGKYQLTANAPVTVAGKANRPMQITAGELADHAGVVLVDLR
ncbi:MAG TPA: hypothetical protein VLT45_27695 [Kofleriaceae bacterium]|nr:hypothetical protein [Kofleriaceae bacterium]